MTSTPSSSAEPDASAGIATATIDGIYYASNASNDMMSIGTGQLIEGLGLKGDRYCQNVGTYSVLKEPGRQLTIISADGVEEELLLEGAKSATWMFLNSMWSLCPAN